MRRILLALFFMVLAGIGHAQTITVTSGEHATFSRLLLEPPTDASWRVGRVAGGYEFRLDDPDTTFDLRQAFARIPRTRIAALEDRGGGRLFLSVPCACHLSAFDAQPGYVALDIVDGPTTVEAAPFNDPFPDIPDTAPAPAQPVAPVSATKADDTITPDAGPDPSANLPLTFPTRTFDPFGDVVAHQGGHIYTGPEGTEDPGPNLAPPPPVDPSNRVRDAEATLLDQIARAAAQGLLDADITLPDVPGIDTEPPDPVRPTLDAPPEPAVNGSGHVAITTSIDRANKERVPRRTGDGNACLPDRYFDIPNWGTPLRTGSDIGIYRSDIIGEFDEIDGLGVTALIRHYIYITFGVEALAVLSRFPADIERPDILTMMAQIMDREQAGNAALMVAQMACDGPVALWAAAAQPRLYRYQEIDTAAVRLAFLKLPPHLRRHVGPPLASKFLAINDKTTADALRTGAARAMDPPSAALQLLDARREIATGDTRAATQRLDAAAPTADELLPETLIERIEAALAAGEAVPEGIIDLVESVGFEHRGTETGAALARAEIRALASAGYFAEAFGRLDGARADGTATGDTAIDLGREIFSLLVDNASDTEFLSRSGRRLDEAATLPADLRRKVATRLLDLGFPGAARPVLGDTGALPEIADRMIYARIALAQEKPQVAVGYLAGLDAPEALRLRARALSMARDHPGAMAAYADLGDGDARVREAWRGGNWEALSDLDDGALGEAAALMTDTGPLVDPMIETPLARDRALIAKSRDTRARLDALMTTLDGMSDAPDEDADPDPEDTGQTGS